MEEVDSVETTGATCSSPNQDGARANQGDAPLEPPGKPEDGVPHEFMEGHGEQVDASREERTSFDVAEETQQEPERMTGIDSESGNVTGKRPHDRGKNERRPSGAATDEPLTKTTHARRPPFRSTAEPPDGAQHGGNAAFASVRTVLRRGVEEGLRDKRRAPGFSTASRWR
ncbi:hypothetical protein HPB50_017126 [Hyalomma asiaticum]|uniref:Uncharacterized protein n=1 Tax=Hyalomma asiaticum TaxID=266040 RepID=A0ACB7TIW2_HYAAI|nr:hypothetical protein HPB50_017126 [Hyalomma asiaticum]